MRLEVSKKVLLVHLPQGAAKLQAVKVLVLQKIKSVHRWRCFHMKIWYIKSNVHFLKNKKNLTACNFAAPWSTWTTRVLSFLLTWFAVRPVKWYTQNFESGTCSVVVESWLWLRCRCQWFDLFQDNAVKTLRNYLVVQTFLRQQEAARIWEYHFKGRNQIDWLINCSL